MKEVNGRSRKATEICFFPCSGTEYGAGYSVIEALAEMERAEPSHGLAGQDNAVRIDIKTILTFFDDGGDVIISLSYIPAGVIIVFMCRVISCFPGCRR